MMYRSERPDKGTIVYVGGLTGDVKKEEIESEFEKFGKLVRVWVAFNPPGFAFVEYANKEDAETAVDALHNANKLRSKLRVEISRGRGRGGRGGMSGRGDESGSFRGGRGGFRGGRGDFRGGRLGDFGRGRGGRDGLGGGRPFGREEEFKPFRGGGMGGRFDDYEERRRSEFDGRDYELDYDTPRDFGVRRDAIGAREFGDIETPRGFGMSRGVGVRDFPPRDDDGRDFPARDFGRDFGPSDVGVRDFPPRDVGRDYTPRDGQRDFASGRGARNFVAREYGEERGVNGTRSYGSRELPPVERAFGTARDVVGDARDFTVSQAALGGRTYGVTGGARDFGSRDMGDGGRDFIGNRDVGMRRDPDIRDFNSPRDLGNPREFGGRPSRIDYAEGDRFGGVRGGFDGGRYSGGDVGGSGDYGSYGARDRFRSRSPIGRGSRPLY